MDKNIQTNFDLVIKKAKEAGILDEQEALHIIVNALKNSNGYYKWSTIDQEDISPWLIRFPRLDMPEEIWLKEENADVVHICDPIKYLEGAEKRDKDIALKATAYVRDDSNKQEKIEEFRCMGKNCKTKGAIIDENMAKKIKAQIYLYKLRRVA